MKFPAKAAYTKGEIDRAGRVASSSEPSSEEFRQAVEIINKWRVGHSYPMHTFNMTLRNKAFAIDKNAVVARRLKRMPTILDKLGSRNTSMNLSRMQDIGGVRAIVSKIDHVYQLAGQYSQQGRFSHKLRVPIHDYIKQPKPSGYRGIHLVFEFNNSQGRGPHSRDYDGLNVEVQLRTKMQHNWATAVETIGMVRHEELKSSVGNERWLTFFQYMSSIMALLEDQPVLDTHRHLKARTLFKHTHRLIIELNVLNVMNGWVTGLNLITDKAFGAHYNILSLDVNEKTVRVTGFHEGDLDEANQELAKFEAEAVLTGAPEPVLVAAGDLRSLKKAYPNYFLDVKEFLDVVRMVEETTAMPVQ